MRTFIYSRVSTNNQTTTNQILEIKQRGYEVPDSRIVEEVISGTTQAMNRPQFKNLIDNKMEAGDKLVVLKLDRLGRDSIDVKQTVIYLQSKGIKVISLDLGEVDLTSPEGGLMFNIMSAFAEFERMRIIERTQEGLSRAKMEGKRLGRPEATKTKEIVQNAKQEGLSQSQASIKTGLSIATVKRHWNEKGVKPD